MANSENGGIIASNESVLLDVLKRKDTNGQFENTQMEEWYQRAFSMKQCAYFITKDDSQKQRCCCGRLRYEHNEWIDGGFGNEWSAIRHVKESPTNAFGQVSFSPKQHNASLGAEYVRLSDSTNVEAIWNMMKNFWSLKEPKLILSIIGGNSSTDIDLVIKQSLENGLAKIIAMTDIWLFTSATKAEITKLAGKVFQENYRRDRSTKNACIGIAPWGCIAEREQLTSEDFIQDVLYAPSSNMLEEKTILEEHHTQFLLVDNGTINQFGTERKLRAKLEQFLNCPADSKSIPYVNLLVHGGYNACMQMKENLARHPVIPTVILKYSGGLADILVDALDAHKEEGKTGHKLLNHIAASSANSFAHVSPEKLHTLRGVIKKIVEEHNAQVIICDPKGDPYGLHHAIVEACKSSSPARDIGFKKLQLAIQLGEIETAMLNIQSSGKDAGYLEGLLYKSIKTGKGTFVEFLLNYGVSLEKFFSNEKKYLQKLYKKRCLHGGFLRTLLSNNEIKQVENSRKFDMRILDKLLYKLMQGDYTNCFIERVSLENKEEVGMSPSQQLMIWAALNKMHGMVECFWKFETDKALENALVLFRIYKRLATEDSLDEIDCEELKKMSETYEKRAVELLSFFYKQNCKSTLDVVKSRIPLWGFNNMVTLAANGVSRNFVAHLCCQIYLEDVWLGKCERNTVKSTLAQLKLQSRHRPAQSHAGVAADREEKYRPTDNKDETDEVKIPRHKRWGQNIVDFFRFFVFVPKGKLFLHEFIFTLFLVLFAYNVLVKKGQYHNPFRYIVFTIVTSLAIDEIREIAEMRKRSVWLKLRDWFKSVWNKLDALAITLFYVGFAFGFYDFKTAERTIMAIDLVIWVVKFAQFYRMFYTLGPYLIMIYRMMFHMIGFVLVLVIAVIAYGIFMHTLLFPEVDISWEILFQLLFRPYLLVFGELGINSYSLSNNSTVYGTKKISKSTEIIVVIGMCVYLLMANVLLLNMLIAVFNNIYEDIKENSDKIWKYDKYDMIMEFKNKPALPMPLSIFANIPRILFHLCKNKANRSYVQEGIDQILDMKDFQNRCSRGFLREPEKISDLRERWIIFQKLLQSLTKEQKSHFLSLQKP
ncbi:transient receptor potential cation channel subfamily M member 7-like isoform X2 [Rhopilema esculentum]|uniref:transient receptor potential cation channel subfamily M member 7-like isoform X2 n=1 Tax=Rhopilema esculentum TaxID=499914 RepID=UPI0031D5981D